MREREKEKESAGAGGKMLRERKEEDREKTAKEAGKENILNFVCFLTLDDNVHAYLKTSF